MSVQSCGANIEQPESAPRPSTPRRRDRRAPGVRMAPSDGMGKESPGGYPSISGAFRDVTRSGCEDPRYPFTGLALAGTPATRQSIVHRNRGNFRPPGSTGMWRIREAAFAGSYPSAPRTGTHERAQTARCRRVARLPLDLPRAFFGQVVKVDSRMEQEAPRWPENWDHLRLPSFRIRDQMSGRPISTMGLTG